MQPCRTRSPIAGFTLVELVLVIILIGVLGSAAASRIDAIVVWRQKSDIRKFLTTWEFLYNEALARGVGYRLIVDLDEGAYYVRREIMVEESSVRQVDYLKNLRTQGEQRRRAEAEEQEELASLEKEYEAADERDTAPLDVIFFRSLYADPHGALRLTQPLEFPSLAKRVYLSQGLKFKKVVTRRDETTDGRAFIRFSPRGASDFAVVYIENEDEQVFTAFMNPATGALTVENGEKEFEWSRDATSER